MCILHVTSKNRSFAEFLRETTLPVYDSHEKGDSGFGRRGSHTDFGFKCEVSDREWTDLAGQIEDATAFLEDNEAELRSLLKTHEVDDIRLDFPYSCRLGEDVVVQCDYLPPQLLNLAGGLGVGIELSHYASTLENID